jgi:hypothetical protein
MVKRAGSTVKLSISLGQRDLELLQKRAKRLSGGDVSAAVTDMFHVAREWEGREALAACWVKGATSRPCRVVARPNGCSRANSQWPSHRAAVSGTGSNGRRSAGGNQLGECNRCRRHGVRGDEGRCCVHGRHRLSRTAPLAFPERPRLVRIGVGGIAGASACAAGARTRVAPRDRPLTVDAVKQSWL